MSTATRQMTAEPFVTADKVAEHLAVSSRTVARMVARGVVPCYRPLGPTGPVRFRLSDVEKAMRRAMQTGKRTTNPQVCPATSEQANDFCDNQNRLCRECAKRFTALLASRSAGSCVPSAAPAVGTAAWRSGMGATRRGGRIDRAESIVEAHGPKVEPRRDDASGAMLGVRKMVVEVESSH